MASPSSPTNLDPSVLSPIDGKDDSQLVESPPEQRETNSPREDSEETANFIIYKKRWLVLVTVVILNISNAAVSISIYPMLQ